MKTLPPTLNDRAQHDNARCADSPTLWLLASVPALWLLVVFTFVLRARVWIGRWPRPYDPDPVAVGFWHYHSLQLGMPLMFAAAAGLLLLVTPTFGGCGRIDKSRLAPLALFGAGMGAALWLGRADPWSLFTWLGD